MAVNAELYLRHEAARLAAGVSEPTVERHAIAAETAPVPGRIATPSEQVAHALAELAEPIVASPLTVLPASTPEALWRSLLPDLERELALELRAFRRRMLAAKVPPDYQNAMFPGRRSGAWAILRDIRTLEDGASVEFTLYVRRGKDQLAVWEGSGEPDSLRANFAAAVPGAPPTGDDVCRGFAAALVRHRIAV